MRAVNKQRLALLALCTTVVLFGAVAVNAQVQGPVGEPDPALVGINSAGQLLSRINVTDFEDAAFWRGSMASDEGLITLRRLPGRPAGKEVLQEEEDLGIAGPDEFVLGVRVEFYRRGFSTFSVNPVRPIPIPGITKTISVWVIGRNFNHVLKIQFLDFFGRTKELTLGKLNFVGWKQLTVTVPPSIPQSDFHFFDQAGIRLTGFQVETDPLEAFGTYYVYLDGVRATSDLFVDAIRDEDDVPDGW
jgi:hypothetical protein